MSCNQTWGKGLVIGQIGRFWDIVRELNVDELERELERPPRVRVLSGDAELLERVVRLVFGDAGSVVQRVVLSAQDAPLDALHASGADLEVLAVSGGRPPTAGEIGAAHTLLSRGAPAVLILDTTGEIGFLGQESPTGMPDFPPEHVAWTDLSEGSAARQALARVFLEAAPRLQLALARWCPALRDAVVERLVRETSTANAQFALMSSIPSVLPFVGGLFGGVADTVVLTKNQALLLFKLAGVHGRDVSDKTRLIAEILPVIGGAFLWRTLARGLIGLFPAYVSAVPKAGVAYVGTYTVGQIARFYYDSGYRPPPDAARRFRDQGVRLFKGVGERLKRPSGNEGDR